ncbi:MAG: GGDEF domain-containing protein [Thermodesulfobacteriota bacterium]|nr:GGDEF domain-containing protein [Thermodesulfobacteriota bacterium]
MIASEVRKTEARINIPADDHSGEQRPLSLFTESMVSLLSHKDINDALIDLASLMAQTFPLSAPSICMDLPETRPSIFSVIGDLSIDTDAKRVLGTDNLSYVHIVAGGHPVPASKRIDMPLIDSSMARIVLCINPGEHEQIYSEWVKILAPVINKLIDNEHLRHMVFRDALTGVLNFRAFSEMLASEWEKAKRYGAVFSLIMIDLDLFKGINDEYGHQAGDKVLSMVAERIVQSTRKSDLVFRYGGEEFMVLLPHTDIENALMLAERIRVSVKDTRPVCQARPTISLGVTQYRDGLGTDDLVKEADMGLYRAKQGGRDRTEVVRIGL